MTNRALIDLTATCPCCNGTGSDEPVWHPDETAGSGPTACTACGGWGKLTEAECVALEEAS